MKELINHSCLIWRFLIKPEDFSMQKHHWKDWCNLGFVFFRICLSFFTFWEWVTFPVISVKSNSAFGSVSLPVISTLNEPWLTKISIRQKDFKLRSKLSCLKGTFIKQFQSKRVFFNYPIRYFSKTMQGLLPQFIIFAN